ncbi:MAG: DJ-1/PfpI family protein [Acetobacteraceae bacterium]
MPLEIGLLVFPGVQQLDLTGPYEVFASLPDSAVHLVWKTLDPVASSTGLVLQPTLTMAACPQLDIVSVPGGAGINPLLEDGETLSFLRTQAAGARYITSVCTGALVLGAAGLLRNKRATTHWASHDLLGPLGAIPVKARVVKDGNTLSGGGVTAGIDFALTLAAEVAGRDEAEAIQLQLEYAPAPPFDSGAPDRCRDSVLAEARKRGAAVRAAREALVARIAGRSARYGTLPSLIP